MFSHFTLILIWSGKDTNFSFTATKLHFFLANFSFFSQRSTSPIHKITDVPTMILTQSPSGSGTTLNISPPKLTMRI